MRKKCMALGLLLCLLPGLAGCRFHKSDSMDFYYVRNHYQYGQPQGVICPESRDVTGHAQDLPYLMALYLEKQRKKEIPFAAGIVPFLLTLVLVLVGDMQQEGVSFRCLVVLDAGCTQEELLEVIGMSDKVLVMYENNVTAQLTGADITEENIMRNAMGVDSVKEA